MSKLFSLNSCDGILVQFVIVVCVSGWSYLPTYNVTNSLDKRLAFGCIRSRPFENTVTGPLLIRFALCKLATVASGQAKIDLMSVLGFERESLLTTCYLDSKAAMQAIQRADVIVFNRIYLHYKYDVDQGFMANATDKFGVMVDRVGFDFPRSAMNFINRFVESHMLRRIQGVITPEDVSRATSMIVVNAAHFKTTWETPFDIRETRATFFYHLNHTVANIPMMVKTNSFQYFNDLENDFQLATLFLRTWGASVSFAVPNTRHGLPQLLKNLLRDPDIIRKARDYATYNVIKISIPRFRMKTTIDYSEPLKQIGLKRIFNESSSDLNNMLYTNNKALNVYLSKVKQKIFLEVDEFGAFRQAETGPYRPQDSIPEFYGPHTMKKPELRADHPFIFTVNVQGGEEGGPGPGGAGLRTEKGAPKITTYELFVGVYYGPTIDH